MSTFQSFGSFAIHTDNAENQGIRKTKAVDMHGKPPATKRAALGTITNIQRVQPVRTAKQATKPVLNQDENVLPAKSFNSQPFTIHVDNEFVKQKSQSHLHSSVASLRPVLAEIKPQPVIEDSPMVLDTSIEYRTTEETSEQKFQKVLSCQEYSREIYSYLREAEEKYRPKVGYMKKQPDINNSMRCILVDWLVEVAEEYRLHRETMCLAVNYIDRFLSQMSVLRGKLQLVGAASIFLASKYEEIYPPEVGEFVYITDDTYTKKQVLKMEHLVLKVLSFDVACPTVNVFCERFMHNLGFSESDEAFNLAMYLCELSLVDADTYLRFLPSEIAASACCLANHTLGNEPWPQSMVDSSGYTYEKLLECTQALFATYIRAPSHPQQAVREKYRQSKYKEVSNRTPASTLPYQELVLQSIGSEVTLQSS